MNQLAKRYSLSVLCLALAACGGSSKVGEGEAEGEPSSKSQTIGSSGGTVVIEDVSIEVPPGALKKDETLTVSETEEAPPKGYEAYTPVYRFEPQGLTFAEPVTVTFTVTGEAKDPVIFWSTIDKEDEFDRMPTTIGKGTVSTEVSHFSLGFVGNPAGHTCTFECCSAADCPAPDPATVCVDDDPTLVRTRSLPATCVLGTCAYTESDEICNDPSGDPACFVGGCSDGECVYKIADYAPCDDLDLCTTDDYCVSGVCVSGAPTECTTMIPYCEDDTLVSPSDDGTGVCNPATGICDYAASIETNCADLTPDSYCDSHVAHNPSEWHCENRDCVDPGETVEDCATPSSDCLTSQLLSTRTNRDCVIVEGTAVCSLDGGDQTTENCAQTSQACIDDTTLLYNAPGVCVESTVGEDTCDYPEPAYYDCTAYADTITCEGETAIYRSNSRCCEQCDGCFYFSETQDDCSTSRDSCEGNTRLHELSGECMDGVGCVRLPDTSPDNSPDCADPTRVRGPVCINAEGAEVAFGSEGTTVRHLKPGWCNPDLLNGPDCVENYRDEPCASGRCRHGHCIGWQALFVGTSTAPEDRADHTAVATAWPHLPMIVWGGVGENVIDPYTPLLFSTGGRYDEWESTSTVSSPSGRRAHTAVWTGTQMIVWGGEDWETDDTPYRTNTGGTYDLLTDSWTATDTATAPIARAYHSAVWTGEKMIIWGGNHYEGWDKENLVSGGLYDPASNTWENTAEDGAPTGRTGYTAIWADTEMLIWGGLEVSGQLAAAGGRYNPGEDIWQPIDDAQEVSQRRSGHTAVWTGAAMLVWGGNGATAGGVYVPGANPEWREMSTENAPDHSSDCPRMRHSAVWTGSQMIVWGGACFCDSNPSCEEGSYGGIYTPDDGSGSWEPMPTDANEPAHRVGHTAVWDGSSMMIWGGAQPNTEFLEVIGDTGASFGLEDE